MKHYYKEFSAFDGGTYDHISHDKYPRVTIDTADIECELCMQLYPTAWAKFLRFFRRK